MARGNGRAESEGEAQSEANGGGRRRRRLLRSSHVFTAVVREILETKLLREASPLPLTVPQFNLLKLMTHNGRHYVGEVADFLGVSPPAATKNIDKLEHLGLVVRTPSEGDRRATLLSVSPKGRRLVRQYDELKTQRLARVLEQFSPEEIERLSDLLDRFAVTLMDLEGAALGSCLRCAADVDAACPISETRGGCPYLKGRTERARGVARQYS